MYAICVEEPPFLLVTEFLPHGDLKNYLKKKEAKDNLSFDKMIRISENVSSIILLELLTRIILFRGNATLT